MPHIAGLAGLVRAGFLGLVAGGLAGCVGVAGPVAPPQPQPQLNPMVQQGPVAPGGVVQPGMPYSATCYAGFYVCPMPQSLPVNTRCSCPGLGAPSFGFVR